MAVPRRIVLHIIRLNVVILGNISHNIFEIPIVNVNFPTHFAVMNVQNAPLPTEREYSMRKHAEPESVELCNVKLL